MKKKNILLSLLIAAQVASLQAAPKGAKSKPVLVAAATPPPLIGPGGEQRLIGPGGEQKPLIGPGGEQKPLIGPGGMRKMPAQMSLAPNAMEIKLRSNVKRAVMSLRNIEAKSRRSVSAFVRDQQMLGTQAEKARMTVMQSKQALQNYLSPENGMPEMMPGPALAVPAKPIITRARRLKPARSTRQTVMTEVATQPVI